MARKKVEIVFSSAHLMENFPSVTEVFTASVDSKESFKIATKTPDVKIVKALAEPTETPRVPKFLNEFVTTVEEIASWFSKFQVDQIELSISGAIETGEALRLFVSAKGEAGIKVTLKPKQT